MAEVSEAKPTKSDPFSDAELLGIAVVGPRCEFTPDKIEKVPATTGDAGQGYETGRIKNKDRVGLIGLHVKSGRVQVLIQYHKAGWKEGLNLIFGVTETPQNVCWRNPHTWTPDVQVFVNFLEDNTQIAEFEIHFRDD